MSLYSAIFVIITASLTQNIKRQYWGTDGSKLLVRCPTQTADRIISVQGTGNRGDSMKYKKHA